MGSIGCSGVARGHAGNWNGDGAAGVLVMTLLVCDKMASGLPSKSYFAPHHMLASATSEPAHQSCHYL